MTIQEFLNGSLDAITTAKASIVARKIDANDKTENAKRFLAISAKECNELQDFVQNVSNRMFNDVRTLKGKTFGKRFVVQAFVTSSVLDELPCFIAMNKTLARRFNCDEMKRESFVKSVKALMKKHLSRTNNVVTTKLSSLNAKTKAFYTGKEVETIIGLFTETTTTTKRTKREKVNELANVQTA